MPAAVLQGRGGVTNYSDFAVNRMDPSTGRMVSISPNSTSMFSPGERDFQNQLGQQGNWATDLGQVASAAYTGWSPALLGMSGMDLYNLGGVASGGAGTAAFDGGSGYTAGSSGATNAEMFGPGAADRLDYSLGPNANAEAFPNFGPGAPGQGFGSDFDFLNTLATNPGIEGGLPPGIDTSGFGSSFDAPGMPSNGYQPGMSWEDILKRLRSGSKFGGALSVGSGLYGMYQAAQTRKIAQQAAQMNDPFSGQRAQYAQQLSDLRANPGKLAELPGYKAGLQAVERRMASQGYLGSGNMMNALFQQGGSMYDAEIGRLSQLAGAGMGGGGNALIAGNASANNLVGSSLASLGYGAMNLWRD